ncbi:MAG: hypothetical protein KKD28_02125, partial [Chloroflexi bacterium]|nr:hypothetical protein [Chloroflexota bacterium]
VADAFPAYTYAGTAHLRRTASAGVETQKCCFDQVISLDFDTVPAFGAGIRATKNISPTQSAL